MQTMKAGRVARETSCAEWKHRRVTQLSESFKTGYKLHAVILLTSDSDFSIHRVNVLNHALFPEQQEKLVNLLTASQQFTLLHCLLIYRLHKMVICLSLRCKHMRLTVLQVELKTERYSYVRSP